MSTTINRYIESIERAVTFMQTSLESEDTPSLAQLADAACMSRFHFHRIYRLFTGETCQQTLTRLKLAKAASGIQANQQNITNIAFDAGYASSQAFAKALRRHAHTTASQLRKEPERLAQTIETLNRPADKSNAALSIELVNLKPITVMAIHTGVPYQQLNIIYEQLFSAAGGPQNVEAILGIPGPDTALLAGEDNVFDCALLLAQPLEHLPSPCENKHIHGGRYLRMRHRGSFNNLDASIDDFYSQLLSQSGIDILDGPCLLHYLDDPEQVEEAFLRTDIYLPVVESDLP